jgi:plasmid stabilization system protein ParE
MKKTVRLETDAEDEFDAAAAWYERQRPGLGQDFIDEVAHALALVGESPDAFGLLPNVPRDLGIRRAGVSRFPYAVLFFEQPEVVRVLAIAHQRRRPGYWRGRLVPG